VTSDLQALARASAGLGIELLDVAPSSARLRMTVRDDMVNGHAIAHGGFIFALADSAFAVACNTHGVVTVAAGCDITFAAPARLGDVLLADAVETDGVLIAILRGRSRSLGRPIPGVEPVVAEEKS
jgi:acyl-CoA thioesterase